MTYLSQWHIDTLGSYQLTYCELQRAIEYAQYQPGTNHNAKINDVQIQTIIERNLLGRIGEIAAANYLSFWSGEQVEPDWSHVPNYSFPIDLKAKNKSFSVKSARLDQREDWQSWIYRVNDPAIHNSQSGHFGLFTVVDMNYVDAPLVHICQPIQMKCIIPNLAPKRDGSKLDSNVLCYYPADYQIEIGASPINANERPFAA